MTPTRYSTFMLIAIALVVWSIIGFIVAHLFDQTKTPTPWTVLALLPVILMILVLALGEQGVEKWRG
jgi:ABC-type uncharacterized transport system permease subunit